MRWEMWCEQTEELERHQAQPVGGEAAPVDEQRIVRLRSSVTAWPLILPLSSVVFVLVAVAAAGACLTDFPARWRWGLGVVTSVALLGALVMYVGPATKRAKGAMRKPSRTVAADARAS